MSFLWYWPAGGWSFDKWKSQQKFQPNLKTEQSGKEELVLGNHHDWQRATDAIIGKLTDNPPAKPEYEVLTETYSTDKYRMRRLRYKLTDNEWGYAWMMVPIGAKGPRPTIIGLHQTVPQGKHQIAGVESGKNDNQEFGRELAQNGFVVFCPDAIAFGERMMDHQNAYYRSADQFFSAHPEGSVMGKMCFDVSRGIDLLETLPEVDASRIGCVGHSHGAYGTLFAMIADQRIRCGAMSCGASLLRTDPHVERWWRMTALMPRLGFYEGHMQDCPIDFHQWIAMVAPRPLMVVNALHDQIFPNTQTLTPAIEISRQAWEDPSKLIYYTHNGSHQFPEDARKKAYQMFAKELA
jgi:dienelactone hydrolase